MPPLPSSCAAAALFIPPTASRMVLSAAGAWESVGERWFTTFAGVVLIEATKQIYAKPKPVLEAKLPPGLSAGADGDLTGRRCGGSRVCSCSPGWVLAGRAQATSWDCPKPVGIAEPIACGDADLTGVGGPGRNRAARPLRRGCRAWARPVCAPIMPPRRKYLATLCLGDRQPGGSGVVDCLKQEYDVRRAALARAVEVAGGVTLLRNERFDARPAQMAEESARPVLTEIAWPQLDRATSAAQRRWNEAMAKSAEQLAIPLDRQDPDTDISVDYRIDMVGAELIQAVFSRDLYIHGAAHGDDMTVSSLLFLLQPARGCWSPGICFRPGAKPWQRGLAELAYLALADAARQESWRLWPGDATGLVELVAEPTRWLLTRDGLTLHFDPYDVGDYAAGMHDVTIPWPAARDLSPGHPCAEAAAALRGDAQRLSESVPTPWPEPSLRVPGWRPTRPPQARFQARTLFLPSAAKLIQPLVRRPWIASLRSQ